MDVKGQTVGDIKAWATKVLHDELEKIINAKSGYSLPYYILVIMKTGYTGPPAYGNKNELLHGETSRPDDQKGEKTIDLSKKRCITQRILLLSTPPKVPLIGSSLWLVNNKTGQIRCMYILPPDKPMIGGFDIELESESVVKCGSNMPYIYGKEG